MKKIIFAFATLVTISSFASQAEIRTAPMEHRAMMEQQMHTNNQNNNQTCMDSSAQKSSCQVSEQQWKTPVLNVDSRVTNK